MTHYRDSEPKNVDAGKPVFDYMASWMNQEQREHLRQFDGSLKTVKEADLAISVAGVLSGVKSGSLIEELPKTIRSQQFKELGLYYVPIEALFEWQGEAGPGVIARSSAVADELMQLVAVRMPDPARDARFGELLGFPSTATEYYNRRISSVGTPWELPMGQGTLHDGKLEDYFAQLVFSPEHYEDEMEAYTRPLQKATQALMPHAYAILEKHVSKRQKEGMLRKVADTAINGGEGVA